MAENGSNSYVIKKYKPGEFIYSKKMQAEFTYDYMVQCGKLYLKNIAKTFIQEKGEYTIYTITQINDREMTFEYKKGFDNKFIKTE